MNELALFAGAGGGILGGKLLGWRTVCAVELDPYARDVLVARQNDGCLAPFPIWDDVCTFDGRAWKGRVDVVSGGFPCQDISVAGTGKGIDGERSGLWGQMRRIIGDVRPRFVLVENSPALTTRGGVRVTADLASMGYVGRNGVLGAADAIWTDGSPCADHLRDRIWFFGKDSNADSLRELQPQGSQQEQRGRNRHLCEEMANAYEGGRGRRAGKIIETKGGRQPANGCEAMADANSAGQQEQWGPIADGAEHETVECGGWWTAEPDVGRMAHGVAARVDRLRCLGNGQVPAVAALAWETLR
jgi:DNA (cytosine-5)-methyltransferase 1